MSLLDHLLRSLRALPATRRDVLATALLAAVALGGCGGGSDAIRRLGDGRLRLQVDSDDIVIDRRLESMDGPSAVRRVTLDGERHAMHWQVPPGRHEYRSHIGDQLALRRTPEDSG